MQKYITVLILFAITVNITTNVPAKLYCIMFHNC